MNIQKGIKFDEFGRANGILLVNKPKGITSHDVVDEIRKIYSTKKVGHAGTLDPFAEGLLVLLIGKSTKRAGDLLGLDKEYKATILFGVSTDSHDPEGKIFEESTVHIDKEKIKDSLNEFTPSYIQYVPVFSSVKVKGSKLRVLARSSDSFEINYEKGTVSFKKDEKISKYELPKKEVKVFEISLASFRKATQSDIDQLEKVSVEGKYIAEITVLCSKGTYIRQLAFDIGKKNNLPAMLIGLKRTRIGDWTVDDAVELNLIYK